MFGLINLNKPAGWTSHDCVAKVRKILKIKQVGHGGTLDPAATGVLPIAVGKATRLLPYLTTQKAYRARIRLGVTTTTDDLEGEIIQTHSGQHLSLENVQPHLRQFIGKIEQIPPMYSAIQREGKRMYELARKGEIIDIPSRIVEIHDIEVLNWTGGEFPEIELAIACGSGTYIRSIARDLGKALGIGGTLAQLIRTESCGLHLADSITLEQLEILRTRNNFTLISPLSALTHLETIYLSSDEAQRWCQGQIIAISFENKMEQSVKVLTEEGQFLGMGIIISDSDNFILKPKVVLV
ncbi:tRNA pseudouridine(55) synthase TruB [Aphanothece hegewaldii CCALA 016]|uniref:tRNA pseudouridine synthase B n=1 Tax=Aphanothece hegewaldii CCALA 016 TaxID=2107694 RepID=A0A2T1M0H8_9CHRO|nr:tRNA pseudouridine(55) synthase TruB [Aphanothece hegewaldii]PSF38179.1 tRNA pseudouridine(55) synthase TruB [Aphanothece hegewaldii CCALA 016]